MTTIPTAENPEMTNATSTAISSLVMGRSGEWWDFFVVVALSLAALTALAIVVSTAGSVLVHKKEAEEAKNALALYKTQAATEIAGAAKAASDAAAAAYNAGAQAGEANLKAAELEKQAASAKLETERLKQVLQWRSISEPAGTALKAALINSPGAVNLRWMDGDPEALYLAIQISKILSEAKWQVAPGALKPANSIFFGIGISSDGEDGPKLKSAFNSAQIPFSTDAVSTAGVSFNISTIPGAPMLMIGSKPPPQF